MRSSSKPTGVRGRPGANSYARQAHPLAPTCTPSHPPMYGPTFRYPRAFSEAAQLTSDETEKRNTTLMQFSLHGFQLALTRASTLSQRLEQEAASGGEAALVAAGEVLYTSGARERALWYASYRLALHVLEYNWLYLNTKLESANLLEHAHRARDSFGLVTRAARRVRVRVDFNDAPTDPTDPRHRCGPPRSYLYRPPYARDVYRLQPCPRRPSRCAWRMAMPSHLGPLGRLSC